MRRWPPRASVGGMSDFSLSDLLRRLHNLVSIGTVAEVDHAGGRLRATIAGRLTGRLPIPALVGRNFRAHVPMREGTQVLVAAPSGNPANGVVAGVLYTDALPPPERDPNVDVVLFDNGARLAHDIAAQTLSFDLPAGGTIRLSVGATSIVITDAGVTIAGNVTVAGSIDASGAILDAGGNTNHHSH
jgi:phage baseplate assembly protein V